jgi:peptidoglycan/xylan/chitin deacetylase (PgdA/CDA1 family)
LEELYKHNAKATFFMVGENVEKHPELVKSILIDGHRIGNHTHNHLNGFKVSILQYLNNTEKCEKGLEPYLNPNETKLFRPPYGRLTPREIVKLKKRGFKIIVENRELLSFEQDLAVSFPNLRFAKTASYDKDGNITKVEYAVNTDNTETAIYTTESHNTPLSWDDLNIILKSWEKEQREEFLDKVTLISAIFFPKIFERVATLKELSSLKLILVTPRVNPSSLRCLTAPSIPSSSTRL